MKKSLLILSLLVLSLTVNAQTSSKNEKIKHLLEISGTAKIGIQAMDQMISYFQNSYSDVGQKFWDDFRKEISAEGMIELIIPIYDKYYTESDIDQLIVFYNSPVGKKMINTMPQVMQESMAAGQNWGKQIGKKIIARLKENGYMEK